MKGYKHINEWERRQIYGYLRDGKSPEDIGRLLCRDAGTIGREIRRWSRNSRYEPMYAQLEYERRRSKINMWRRKITRYGERASIIRKYLIEEHWMPWSISWRGKVDVCTQSIYNYIREEEASLQKYLVRKRWYKKGKRWSWEKKGEGWRSIEEREGIVELRIRQWDREIDTIHSSGSERKGWIVTITDRMDKYVEGGKIGRRTKEEVWRKIIEILWKQKEKLFTITVDNGKEFNGYQEIEKSLGIPIYFAHPYSSYERWSNEHTNWMVRVFYPKGTDFTNISDEEIQNVFKIINLKPRKSLWYLTPYEVRHGVRLNL
jgi:transposase, IS30 family